MKKEIIPPTFTQIPNVLIDDWMPQLSDTAYRIVTIIARQTFGWIEDKETGMRKKEDWISYSQLETKTGRRKAAISIALRELEEKDLIQIRDAEGNVLKTIEERTGKRLFYRLNITSSESEPDLTNQFGKRSSESEVRKANTQKKDIQNKLIQNLNTNVLRRKSPDLINGYGNPDINEGITLLRESGVTSREEPNRYALNRLYKKYGKDKTLKVFRWAQVIRTMPYAPAVYNFLDLEEKWPLLETYAARNAFDKNQIKKGVIDARGI